MVAPCDASDRLSLENKKDELTSKTVISGTGLADLAARSNCTTRFTKLNYCQYLLSRQINYTFTNLANHLEAMIHDEINPY
jgi:2-hydroxy-3-keto-5-methylthiopentenyl-1-phosphate phosphatase